MENGPFYRPAAGGLHLLGLTLWLGAPSCLVVRVIRQRIYIGYVISTLLAGFPYFMVIYTLPQRLQVVNGKSPLMAGVSILPMLASVAIGSAIGGAVNGTKNRTFHTLLAGSILLVLGTATLSTLTNSVKVQGGVYGFQVFVGLGFGFTVFHCESRCNFGM